jgi:hypothetical protein
MSAVIEQWVARCERDVSKSDLVPHRGRLGGRRPASGELAAPEPGSKTVPARDDDLARLLVASFVSWFDRFGERSYDPHDFWACRLGRTAKRLYYRRPIVGALAVMPFVALDTFYPSSRRLVASPHRYAIADAHYEAGFFHWAAATGDNASVSRGVHFLDVLEESRCEEFDEFCWGYPFQWESRSGTVAAGTPLMTTVPYAYEAFELGFEATGRAQYLRVMASIAAFASNRIPTTEFDDGSVAAGYTPSLATTVVNASSYRGFLLASAGKRFARRDWTEAAQRNIAFVLRTQRSDGSWPYAMQERDDFVDNFHTCLVLKNLFKFWRLTDRVDVLDAVRRGYAFYRRALLDAQLEPRPFAVKPRLTLHTRDLYDYSEGLNLAVLLRDVEGDARQVLHRILHSLAKNWVLRDGHFVTRRLFVGRNTIPYHRWAQSQAFHALAHYCRSVI